MRYVVAPRTVLAGFRKVTPGSLIVADSAGVRERRWYDPRFCPHPPRSHRTCARRADGGVRKPPRASVASLPGERRTGGAPAQRRHRQQQHPRGAHGERSEVPTFTYTLVPDEPGLAPSRSPIAPSSVPASRDVRVTAEQRLDAMSSCLGSLTEPVGDGAALATWLLIHRAREKAEVFLCGHGGDELLGGYRLSQDRFRLAAIHYLAYLPAWSLHLLIGNKTFGAERVAERQRAVRRAAPRLVPAAARYLIQKPLPPDDVRAILGSDALAEPYLAKVDELYATSAPDAGDLDRIQEVMIRTFLSENILSFADSVAMDSSAELRMPFLDRDLVEFALSLAPTARVSGWPGRSNTKQILRWWARGRIPDDVLERRKRRLQLRNAARLPGARRRRSPHSPAAGIGRSRGPSRARSLARAGQRDFFRGAREHALWAILALADFCESIDLH